MPSAPVTAQATLAAAAASATRRASCDFAPARGQTANRKIDPTAPIAASSATPSQPLALGITTVIAAATTARDTNPRATQRHTPRWIPRLSFETVVMSSKSPRCQGDLGEDASPILPDSAGPAT